MKEFVILMILSNFTQVFKELLESLKIHTITIIVIWTWEECFEEHIHIVISKEVKQTFLGTVERCAAN